MAGFFGHQIPLSLLAFISCLLSVSHVDYNVHSSSMFRQRSALAINVSTISDDVWADYTTIPECHGDLIGAFSTRALVHRYMRRGTRIRQSQRSLRRSQVSPHMQESGHPRTSHGPHRWRRRRPQIVAPELPRVLCVKPWRATVENKAVREFSDTWRADGVVRCQLRFRDGVTARVGVGRIGTCLPVGLFIDFLRGRLMERAGCRLIGARWALRQVYQRSPTYSTESTDTGWVCSCRHTASAPSA